MTIFINHFENLWVKTIFTNHFEAEGERGSENKMEATFPRPSYTS